MQSSANFAAFTFSPPRLTIKLDRLIVLSKSSLLGWFLHVSLIVIIKGRSPMEVSLIVIIKQVWAWLSLIIKPFSPLLSQPFQVCPWFTGPNRCCLLWMDEAKANIKPIYECRCNGRLQTKRFTRLAHTGLVVELEHLKIKTRLTNEKFASVKGECEI